MLTAREAMEQAIRKAETGMIEGARLWLDIARELREGVAGDQAVLAVSGPVVGPKDDRRACYCAAEPGGHDEGSLSGCVPGEIAPIRPYPRDPEADDYPQDFDVVTFDTSTIDGTKRTMTVPVPRERLEQRVQRDLTTETTPIYEGAGDDLGETAVIPVGVAHPNEDGRGPNSMCLGCNLGVIWLPRLGWVHDLPGAPASCEEARQLAP
jgi:hypothetical protein